MRKPKDKKYVPPELDDSVIGTMRINPRAYKRMWNSDLAHRTKYALAGLLFMIRRERSIGNVAKMGLLVLVLSLWVRIELIPGALIFLSFALLWTVETINSSIEAVVDLVTQEVHPLAKVAKDVAASATLVATITAFITTAVFLFPLLFEKIVALVPS